jgi:hypothetical protein
MLGRAKLLHGSPFTSLKRHIAPFVPKYIPDELYGAFNAIASCFPKPRPYLEVREYIQLLCRLRVQAKSAASSASM